MKSWAHIPGIFRWMAFAVAGASVPVSAEPLGETMATLEEWVDVERRIAAEQAEWETKKASMHDLIELYEQELAALDAEMEASEEDLDAAEEERAALTERDERLKAVAENVHTHLSAVEAQLKRLRPRLPPPLQEELEPLYGQLPNDPAAPEISAGQRVQYVVGLLTQIRNFNAATTVAESIRDFPDGERVPVEAIYFGLGTAFYVDQANERAGYATLEADGWRWQDEAALSEPVRRAVEMSRGTREADYVELPVRID